MTRGIPREFTHPVTHSPFKKVTHVFREFIDIFGEFMHRFRELTHVFMDSTPLFRELTRRPYPLSEFFTVREVFRI